MSSAKSLKTQNPIRIILFHEYVDTDVARKIRTSCSRPDFAVSLGEDFSAEGKLSELKTVDVAAALFTSTPTIALSEVLQQVGAARALEKPILLLVSRRDILNLFSFALKPKATLVFDVGDLETREGAERFAATFENAIRDLLTTSARANASSVGAFSR